MRLTGLVFRAHHPRWAFAPDSGDGAARYGGRFNPFGMPALYTARRVETAWLEAQQGFPFKAQPMTLIAYEVDCADIEDLTDTATSARWDVDPAMLACPWEAQALRRQTPPSWTLARRMYASDIAGIIVPSFAPGAGGTDCNVVFWRWGAAPHRVTVIDGFGRLPRDGASWR